MGDRSGRTTRRFDSSDLIALTKKSIVEEEKAVTNDDDPFADWGDQVEVAAGSQSNALPTTSRTATLADPMATALLAEVARRTSTIEIDPSTVELVRDRDTQEIDTEILAAALRDAQRTPAPTIEKPEAHANVRRRIK